MKNILSTVRRLSIPMLVCLLLVGCGGSSSDTTDTTGTIETNTVPTVEAGTDQSVASAATVSLAATISDDDTDYTVTWSQTSGTTVTLSNTSSAATSFTAPTVSTAETLVFQVLVNDGVNAAVSDTVSIEVTAEPNNTSLTVDAGTDQSIASGASVSLVATISDADTDYTLTWSQTSGTTVTLSNTSSAATSFTAPTVSADETLVFQVSVNDGVNAAVSDTLSITVTSVTSTTDSVWIMNTSEERSSRILASSSSLGALVNVQSVAEKTIDGKAYTVVTSQGVPKYDVTVTQAILDGLTSRPKASSDFISGSPTISLGDVIEFGTDIGYNSNSNCTLDYGFGYWPPGPDCPTQDSRTGYFPVEPTPTTEDCDNGLGKVGYWVNGSSIYNWGDGMSYNNAGAWQNLAPVAEYFDVDVCGGHAANGDYHFHFYSSCLADLVGDKADGHSPIYGFAADGYPVYGPWQSEGELAISSWIVRDYSDATVGCPDGERSCSLVDQYDITQGTETVTAGPGFDDTVTTLSSNVLVATNGYYYEDHYWDSTLSAQGGNYLDQYNGHTDSERGYHYHITLSEDSEGSMQAAFPYIIGTRFAGQLEDNAIATCSTGAGGGPGGPGGPPAG